MPYDATIINVMIACPSDVSVERQIVKDSIQVWNSVNAEDKQIVLMPIAWDTHSSPRMGETRKKSLTSKCQVPNLYTTEK